MTGGHHGQGAAQAGDNEEDTKRVEVVARRRLRSTRKALE
jgi:hypothetical protein